MIKFRRAVPEDLLTLATWIAADPAHAGAEAGFWATTSEGISCFAVEDDCGPLMFVRQEHAGDATVIHLQFPPHDRKKVAKALREGYPHVKLDAEKRGYKSIRFASGSPALVRMMAEFGFRAELVADL